MEKVSAAYDIYAFIYVQTLIGFLVFMCLNVLNTVNFRFFYTE